MGDLPGLVRLSIALRIQPNDGPVFYKVDGQRFGQNRTIKLLTGSSYKVEVKIKPTTLQVENISIGGVLVPLELKSKEPDGDRIVYTGTYDTEGVAPTKSGERQPIQITMPFWRLEVQDQGISRPGICSLTLGPSRRYGRSSFTITTSEITASGEAPSPSSSTNASPMRPAVSCG
ncbi:CB1 cannabinoid receptor-interacting protein 1 isoform X1 [Mesoplodon densirostris]|uniref:CB1 cannabinoid receptor-interacting protein 1 isoform X1 n=1 Tax=Mesoplodon densirostris TaxID=48708 RepID=UPI0028DCE332|nr:CB1 cannabinoid receptor-interacting protein 1 isoform X1 [Mesoplodon densirostris]